MNKGWRSWNRRGISGLGLFLLLVLGRPGQPILPRSQVGPAEASSSAAAVSLEKLAPATKRAVLVLHSYHAGYKWTDDIMNGILAALESELPNVDLHVEYMDAGRTLDELYVQQLVRLYEIKFHDRKFDVIISSDDEAFDFLRQYRDRLFPGTPVVFCGVNFFQESALAGQELFTGVNEEVDITSSLDLALALHPRTRLIAVVNDATPTGQKVHDRLAEVLPAYQDRVKFVFLEHVNMKDIQDTVRALPPNSLIYYTLFSRDKSGTLYEYDDSIRTVVEASQVPVYGAWDFGLGYGIVGGMLTSGYYQGEAAASLAVRILNGQDPGDVPLIMASPNRYMFDYEQLQRFRIPVSSLPQDSMVINQPVTFYQRYKGWIWGGSATLIGLVSIILALLSTSIRRKRAEEALRLTNIRLHENQELLEQRVAERTMALDRRSNQLQAAAQVARDSAAIRDVQTLLEETVSLISERMGFYHAGLFLLDEAGEYAVLRAASSEGGRKMLAERYQLPVGKRGIVGRVAATGEARVALDVGQDAVFFDEPHLPLTRSEMALPLAARGQVIGVLDVQSTEPEAFTQEDVAIVQTLADQVSLAIENARLLEETQDRLREISLLARERTSSGWARLSAERPDWAYVYDGVDVLPRDAARARPVSSPQWTIPLQTQTEVIGHLELSLEDRLPTSEEMEVAQAIADRVCQALERARLFQESQIRAAQERLLREITDSIRSAATVEDAIQRAIREMGRVLNSAEIVVRIGSEQDLLAVQDLISPGPRSTGRSMPRSTGRSQPGSTARRRPVEATGEGDGHE